MSFCITLFKGWCPIYKPYKLHTHLSYSVYVWIVFLSLFADLRVITLLTPGLLVYYHFSTIHRVLDFILSHSKIGELPQALNFAFSNNSSIEDLEFWFSLINLLWMHSFAQIRDSMKHNQVSYLRAKRFRGQLLATTFSSPSEVCGGHAHPHDWLRR